MPPPAPSPAGHARLPAGATWSHTSKHHHSDTSANVCQVLDRVKNLQFDNTKSHQKVYRKQVSFRWCQPAYSEGFQKGAVSRDYSLLRQLLNKDLHFPGIKMPPRYSANQCTGERLCTRKGIWVGGPHSFPGSDTYFLGVILAPHISCQFSSKTLLLSHGASARTRSRNRGEALPWAEAGKFFSKTETGSVKAS